MLRTTTARPAGLALLTAALAGLALPVAARAMGTMTAQSHVRPIPERICRPNVTCLAQWHMTTEATVPLSPGEVVDADHRVVMKLYGDDPVSDDHLVTLSIPFRQPTPNARTCSDNAVPENLLFQSGNRLVIRGCFISAKRYGPFNEDRSVFDDGDELYVSVRLITGRGVTVRSATARSYGRY